MKKKSVLACVLVLILLLTACGGGNSKDSQNSADGNNESNEKKQYKLTYNVAFPKGDPEDVVSISTERFAEEIYKRTNGQVQIDVFYSSQLAPVDQILTALEKGSIDMAYSLPEYYGEVAPTGFYGSLPFLGKDIDEFISLLREKGIADIMNEEFEEHGAKILLYATPGEYGFLSKKPIRTVEDMKGLTARAGNSLWTPWYEAMGTAPANIPSTDIYQALQLGTVDAVASSLNTIDYYNYHEVVTSITAGLRVSALSAGFISMKTWESLPKDIQQIFLEVAAEIEQQNIAFYRKNVGVPAQFAKEKGIDVYVIEGEAYDDFVESAQILYDKFAEFNERTKKISEIMAENLK